MDALALSLAQQRSEPKTAALALLALGKDLEASALLEAWQPREGVGEAERLALLGFAAFRRGDAGAYEAYRQLVLSKVHIAKYQSCQHCPFSQSSCFPTAVPFLEGAPHAQDICAYLYNAGLGPFRSKVS